MKKRNYFIFIRFEINGWAHHYGVYKMGLVGRLQEGGNAIGGEVVTNERVMCRVAYLVARTSAPAALGPWFGTTARKHQLCKNTVYHIGKILYNYSHIS
jgi:hypothetical protein